MTPMTLAEFQRLDPWNQGYTAAMLLNTPDSEIPLENPYPHGSREAESFREGKLSAIMGGHL